MALAGELSTKILFGSHCLNFAGKGSATFSCACACIALPLPLKPHFISSTSTQWKIEGLKKNGLAENQLHFSRIQDAADKAHNLPSITPSTLPAFIRVERTLNLGLDWAYIDLP
jgi:hypothetical protein